MDEGIEFQREWCCCFCLTVADKKGSERPERCEHCHVVRCQHCGGYIKSDQPQFCYGCGTVFPKVDGVFVGTDQTACVYVEAEWMRRNKGRDSDGTYAISTGYANDGSGRISSWVTKEVVKEDHTVTHEDVRELTDEEKAKLRE